MGVSGGFGGFSASLQVDVSTFKESINEGSEFMSDKTILTAGGSDLPEPIRVRLIPMYQAVHYNFFQHLKNPRLSGCNSAQSMAQKVRMLRECWLNTPVLNWLYYLKVRSKTNSRSGKRERSAIPSTTPQNHISRSLSPQSHRPGNRHLCQTFF